MLTDWLFYRNLKNKALIEQYFLGFLTHEKLQNDHKLNNRKNGRNLNEIADS